MRSLLRRSSELGLAGHVLAALAIVAVAFVGAAPAAHATIGTCDTAGPVEVEATAGPDLGPTAYATLGAAFTAINAGTHQGVINVEICASTSEGATSATLNSSGAGSALYTAVLIGPLADGLTVDGAPASGFGVIQLNGADNVTLDGDNPNSGGINRNLTVSNSAAAATTFGSAVRIATSATAPFDSNSGNTIRNLAIVGNVTGGNAPANTVATLSANNSFGIVVGPNGGAAVTALASVTAGTAAGVTVNGLVVDNNSVNRAGRGISFLGGTSASSTGVAITNNAIGDTSTPTPATPPYTSPATTVYVKGINVQGTNAVTISGNTITNIISYINLAHAAAELTSGIGAGTVSVANNTISNVVVNATASFAAQGVAHISTTVGGATYTISGNIISNIQNFSGSSTAQPDGIIVSTAGGTTSGLIDSNKVTTVYNRSTGTFGSQGITVNGGNNVTIRNNFVSDVNQVINGGTSTSPTFQIVGIRLNSGTGHKVYHNSVNLFGVAIGTGSANNFSSAFALSTTSQTSCDVRNNIFANTMTLPAGTTTSAAISIFLPSSGTAALLLTENNNAYYSGSVAGASGIAHVGTTYTLVPAGPATWAGLYTAANFNPGATTPNANLRAYTSTLGTATNDNATFATTAAAPFTTSSDLHINTGLNPTALESGGAAVGVTVDIDGQTRPGPPGSVNGGGTAADIGADEFDGVPLQANDIQATAFVDPANGGTKAASVTFSPQASFTNNGTATQTNVTVRYRILDNTAFEVYNQTGTIASISPFATLTVTFTPGANLPAGVYTIKARSELVGDQTPANDEITGTLTVEAPLAGTYTVGSGGNFASLTNTNGAFDKLNALGASASVTFSIISNLTGETGAVALNQVSEIGAGGYSYTIKPLNPSTTISGDSTTAAIRALIRINGADRVTIDGSTSGGSDRNLTITNNDLSTASAIIHVSSGAAGAQFDTIKNLVVIGSGNAATFIAVNLGGAAIASLGTDNDNNRVENCDIRKVQFGIASQGASVANKNVGTVITKNLMTSTGTNSLGKGGIIASFEDGIQITQNSIGNILSTASNDVLGISLGGLIGWANTTVTGGSEVSNALVERNNLGIISQANTFSSVGIIVTPATTGTNTIRNNFISGVIANGTLNDFGAGIFIIDSGIDSTTRIYHNSVSMTGTLTGATMHQYALAVNGTDPLIDIRNNILVNTQSTGTTASSYAIGLGYATFANLTSDRNDLFVGTGALFKIGRTVNINPTGGTDQVTLANWQAATGKDATSISANPQFISNTDLHINLCVTSPVANAGIAGLVTDDFDGDLRSGTPDIGGDEYTQAAPCTDGNDCTSDTCVPATGCAFPPVADGSNCGTPGQCENQDTCLTGICQDNGFKPDGTVCGSPADTNCDNPDSCLTGLCNPNYEPNGFPCPDGLNCTTGDTCNGTGTCIQIPVNCDDGSACTSEACVEPAGTCSYALSGACNINGSLRYYRNNVGPVEPSTKPIPIQNVTRTSTFEATSVATTNSSGNYSFTNEGGNITLTPAQVRLMTDEDECHNSITAADAAQIAQASIGAVTFTANQAVAGDVSNNGSITSFDAALTSQKAVANPCLNYLFPVRSATGSDWAFRPVSRSYTPLTGVGEDYSFLGVLYGDVTGNWTAPVLFSAESDNAAKEPSIETSMADASPRIPTPVLVPGTVMAEGRNKGAVLYVAGAPTRNADGTWSVVLGMQRADGILGLDMNLHFDSKSIQVVGVTATGISSAWTASGRVDGDNYQVALFGVEALQGTGAFLKVTYLMTNNVDGLPFGVAAQANEGQIPISWSGVPRSSQGPAVHVEE